MKQIQQQCLDALKLRRTAATYVIKNTIRMEGWDKDVTTPMVLRAMKSLERMGFVERDRRSACNQYEWRLA